MIHSYTILFVNPRLENRMEPEYSFRLLQVDKVLIVQCLFYFTEGMWMGGCDECHRTQNIGSNGWSLYRRRQKR